MWGVQAQKWAPRRCRRVRDPPLDFATPSSSGAVTGQQASTAQSALLLLQFEQPSEGSPLEGQVFETLARLEGEKAGSLWLTSAPRSRTPALGDMKEAVCLT